MGDPEDPEEVYWAYYEPWLPEPVIVDLHPPVIKAPSMSPAEPEEGERVAVVVDIVDDGSGVAEAILSYSVDGGITWTNITMTPSEGHYEAIIPGQPAGTTVIFMIYARDRADNWAISDQYSYTVKAKAQPPPPAPSEQGGTLALYIGISIAAAVAGICVAIFVVKRR